MVAIVWGLNLYGRPIKRLAFCYDRHEEITRYIRMREYILSSNGNACNLLTFKFSAGFVIPATMHRV